MGFDIKTLAATKKLISGSKTDITGSSVISALGYTPANSNKIGVADGIASLDPNGKIPTTQLPSYVNDVIEVNGIEAAPEVGESDKIYVDILTNKTYRWSGTTYIEISTSDIVTASEINGNIKINGAEISVYTHPSGTNPHETTKDDIGLSNVPNVSTNDQTPTFIQSEECTNIASGEKLSIIFGKIARWFTDLKAVAFTGSYNDLSDTPKIPTNVSQLLNDSGYKTTDTTYSNFVKSGNNAKSGLVPAPPTTAGTTKYLREDGVWALPPDTNTTYSNATTTSAGLLSAADKEKLNKVIYSTNAKLQFSSPSDDFSSYFDFSIPACKMAIAFGRLHGECYHSGENTIVFPIKFSVEPVVLITPIGGNLAIDQQSMAQIDIRLANVKCNYFTICKSTYEPEVLDGYFWLAIGKYE